MMRKRWPRNGYRASSDRRRTGPDAPCRDGCVGGIEEQRTRCRDTAHPGAVATLPPRGQPAVPSSRAWALMRYWLGVAGWAFGIVAVWGLLVAFLVVVQ